MKKICFIVSVLLCFLLCSCGSSTPKSAELSEKYDFYKSSISGLKTATGVTAEEADEIFIVLAADCGVDDFFTVTKNTSGDFYNVNYGFNALKVYLDGNAVSEVFNGESQLYPAATDSPNSEENNAPEETEAPADSALEVPHRSVEEIVGVSDKDISDLNKKIVVMSVPNDVTENWKYITLSESTDFLEYALSYYNLYFENDKEIHAVVNFTNKTTTKISVFGDKLEITVHDYVDGEEHDAKIMFSGTPLANYIIYTDNGDIEKAD